MNAAGPSTGTRGGSDPARTPDVLVAGRVTHLRLLPRRHQLRYRMYSLLVDLDHLPALDRRLRCLSVNRFNLFAFHEGDHGSGQATGLADWVRARLREAGLPADGSIRLLTMPRVLGHVFNPISVYFCHAADGRLRALLYEVRNTFGEIHFYLLDVPPDAPADTVRQACAKAFHVSPFLPMEMDYRFRVQPPNPERQGLHLQVDVWQGGQRMLTTHYAARERPLSDRELLRLFFSHPLLTLKVVVGIHWEALRLWLKGIPVHTQPTGAPAAITPLKTGS